MRLAAAVALVLVAACTNLAPSERPVLAETSGASLAGTPKQATHVLKCSYVSSCPHGSRLDLFNDFLGRHHCFLGLQVGRLQKFICVLKF